MSVLLNRRRILKTLSFGAGAALLSPFFAQLGRAQTTGNFPRRFVFVVEGNAVEPITFLSANARTALASATGRSFAGKRWFYNDYVHTSPLVVSDTDFASAPALASIVDDGNGGASLQNDAAILFGLSSKITGGGHSTYHGALSCYRSAGASPANITIDAHLALRPEVRGNAPFDAFRAGISGAVNDPLNYETCAYKKGQAAPIILSPTTAFNTLFGSVASAGGQAAFAKRENLLDFARSDVNRALSVFGGSSQERAKLEGYLEAVEKLVARNQRILEMENENGALSSNKPIDPDTNPLITSGRPLDALQAHFDTAEAALKGGLTNVVVLASGTGGNFNVTYNSISNITRHNLHHGSAGNATYLNAIHDVTKRHVEMITKLARSLQTTPEPGGNGSMLDHTALVYLSDNGEQHHSTASDWPLLLLGGSALGLQTQGRTVVYPGLGQSGHRQVSNVFNSFGYCAGEALDAFGGEGSTRVATGPLSEVYS